MSRIFLTGDCHGDVTWLPDFCKDNNTTIEDYIVLLGDVGINFFFDGRDKKAKKIMSKCPITFICIHGNHEARPSTVKGYILKSYEKLECTCWVQEDYPNILFPLDGKMKMNDKSFLVLGGAYSVDKFYRLSKGWSWFEDEQMDEHTKLYILDLIEECNKYDYVLSHTCPTSMVPTETFLSCIDQSTVDNSMEDFFEKVKNRIYFKCWYFGHYHTEKVGEDFTILYQTVNELE